jgi:glycosyltransferase involved in cell wall biosynthesis
MSDRKRIAVVASSAPPLSSGGVASAHFNLFAALSDAGFNVRLYTFGDLFSTEKAENIVRSGSPGWWVAILRILNRWIFKFIQPGQRAYQLFDILAAIPGSRAMSRRIREWNADIIVLSDHGAPGLAFQKEDAKLLLVSHHNPARFLEPPAPDNYSKLDARLALRLEQRVVDMVDAVVCPSHYMKDFFQQTYKFNGSVDPIPNLMDRSVLNSESEKELRRDLGLSNADTLIYLPSVGSFLKGSEYVEELVTFLSRTSKKQFAFYISGNIEHKYAADINRLGKSHLIYLSGQVDYAENIGLAKQCDFCISLSLMENFSMALLEAALLGMPILAFDTGGNADIVREGENGYLFPLGDVSAMARKAEQLSKRSKLKTERARAIKFNSKELNPDRARDAYIERINSL